MGILAYGEDGLTLWAMKKELTQILDSLDDLSNAVDCTIFYRPSFGRRGDLGSFGEFDFILLTDTTVYLGESKWDRLTGRATPGTFALEPVQVLRHRLMRFYIEEWVYGVHNDWAEFEEYGRSKLHRLGIDKPIAPAGSALQVNLEWTLNTIRRKYYAMPNITNVFLYLHRGVSTTTIPATSGADFKVVAIDCSNCLEGNYIPLDL